MSHQPKTVFAKNSLADLMTGPIITVSEIVRAAKRVCVCVWNRELEGGRDEEDSYRTEEKQIAKPG